MKALVTGGAGFIGTRLVARLLEAGHEVRILDKVESTVFPSLMMIGDVRDEAAVDAAARGMDVAFNLAAEHQDNVRPASLYYDVNVGGARHLVAACTRHGVKRIVFTSSVAVYGLDAGTPDETFEPSPFNDYGRSKLEAEVIFRGWADEDSHREIVIIRPTVIFGEGNRGNVYNLIRQVTSGRFVMVGDGYNRKSMGYVGNIAAFLAYVASQPATGVRIFNYADKPDLDMNSLVHLIRVSCGLGAAPPPRMPFWVGLAGGAAFDLLAAVTRRQFAVSAIRVRKFCASTTVNVEQLAATGFAPPYSLQEGMRRFLESEFLASKEAIE